MVVGLEVCHGAVAVLGGVNVLRWGIATGKYFFSLLYAEYVIYLGDFYFFNIDFVY